jgi:hypothetical protein
MRVGAQSGTPVEDLGIEPDRRCMMTRRDLLEGNRDLLDKAVALIAGARSYTFEFEVTAIAAPARTMTRAGRAPLSPERKVRVTMRTSNIDRVDVLGDGRPMLSHLLKPTRMTTTKTVAIPRTTRAIEVLGFRRATTMAPLAAAKVTWRRRLRHPQGVVERHDGLGTISGGNPGGRASARAVYANG